MKIHDPVALPPGFDSVRRAYAMAAQLPSTHRLHLRVGVASDGVLLGEARLDGYRQVTFLSEQLKALGWRERLLGGQEEMFGCDILYVREPVAGAQEDPSFIRSRPADLWGATA